MEWAAAGRGQGAEKKVDPGPVQRPVCGCAGVPVCRCAGVQVCRCAGVPVIAVIAVVYQYTGVPVYQCFR